MINFDDALNSAIHDADADYKKVILQSEIAFAELLSVFVTSINKQNNIGLDWSASLRKPIEDSHVVESWPDQLKEFYTYCDGISINQEGDNNILRSSELVSGGSLNPKLSTIVRSNLESSHRKKRGELPIFNYGGTQSLLNLMDDDSDHEVALEDLNQQLILQSDNEFNFLVFFVSDVKDIVAGNILDIEGGVATRFTSLKLYLAFQSLVFD